jgi:hypothetical protein
MPGKKEKKIMEVAEKLHNFHSSCLAQKDFNVDFVKHEMGLGDMFAN